MAATQKPKADETTFERGIARLEEIVEQMETDKLPLEELLVRYEEGVKLVQFCSEKLKAAEARIEIITRDAGGKPRAVPFESKPQPEPDAPAAETRDTFVVDESQNVSLF